MEKHGYVPVFGKLCGVTDCNKPEFNEVHLRCQCFNTGVSGFLSWNPKCPLHGTDDESKVISSGLREEIVSLMNEFYWSATVPKARIQQLLDRVDQ